MATSLAPRVIWSLVGVLFAAFALRTLFWSDFQPALFNHWVSGALLTVGPVSALARAALVREGRAAWLVVGLGLASWTIGDIWWTMAWADDPGAPFPSPADGMYLLQYPLLYVALLLLVRSRSRPLAGGLWLDGAIGALAIGAVVAALAVGPIIDSTEATGLALLVSLAYPIFDLVLIILVVVVFGISGWRPGRAWLLLGAGVAVSALADVMYFVRTTGGGYVEGTWIDILWPAASLLVGLAAWQPFGAGREASLRGGRVVAVPFVAAVIALGLLTFDHFQRLDKLALGLTVGTLALVVVRMGMAFRDRDRLLAQSQVEARVDALTGLRNRRALMHDLECQVHEASESRPLALLLFDLDGFKQYNDSFGHPAGDALLTRLGRRLEDAVGERGCVYRLGGDEFCALVAPGASLDSIAARCVAALAEHGEGFSVGTSYGAALVPEEVDSPIEVLKLADRRMYAQKGSGRLSAGRQSRDVLMRTLSERQPELHDHLRGVADLATQVGRELGMPSEQLDELSRAAELHDIGKVAIPDEILNKSGPLDESEWSFIRRHTIIGERILLAAPALRPVARLVRSSHERWDGGGYPDGLAGEEIPLGSRVVAVCDAFDAMTTDRAYRSAISEPDALAELRACAGTQFDPDVVHAFCRVLASREAAGAGAPAPPTPA